MQAWSVAALVLDVITREHGTQSMELFVLMNGLCPELMNVLCPFPKVAGEVKTLLSRVA